MKQQAISRTCSKRRSTLAMSAMVIVMIMLIGTLASSTTVLAADKAAIKNIVLNVWDCNVIVKKTGNDTFSYDYDDDYYKLTTTEKENTLSIKLIGTQKRIPFGKITTIYFPDRAYDKIKVTGTNGGVSLPALNANYDITGNDSAMSVCVAKGFTKTINFNCTDGSGSVNLSTDANNFTINLKTKDSTVSMPDLFPKYTNQDKFTYKKGNGKAAINLNIQDSAFSIAIDDEHESNMKTAVINKVKYFLVTNETQLRSIGSKEYPLSGNYMLDKDIELDDDWIPIGGYEGKPFTGKFDGNGFVISDVTIKDMKNKYKYLGFFGLVEGGELSNITLEDVEITTTKNRKNVVMTDKVVAATVVSGKMTNCKVID